jgi:ribA/ribD-fused uncharacterized protein
MKDIKNFKIGDYRDMEMFVFFWKSNSPFSQWYVSNFIIDGITFNSAEQYMMYRKAVLFKDEEIAKKILKTHSPKEQKALGREVRHFEQEKWEKYCQKFVYEGNYAKFTQNESLKKALLSTIGTLVEASPVDPIWGVGLAEDDPRIKDRSTWKGKNWLGEILTQVRDELLK